MNGPGDNHAKLNKPVREGQNTIQSHSYMECNEEKLVNKIGPEAWIHGTNRLTDFRGVRGGGT